VEAVLVELVEVLEVEEVEHFKKKPDFVFSNPDNKYFYINPEFE
jgi:hypothetical protein